MRHPGPWTIVDLWGKPAVNAECVQDALGERVIDWSDGIRFGSEDAIRLVLAAPEALAALRALVGSFERLVWAESSDGSEFTESAELRAARALIARIEAP
jgi:hypothetical protein